MVQTELPVEAYETLRAQAESQGLFERTRARYFLSVGAGIVGMLVSLYVVTLTDNVWLQFLNALLFVFSSIRVGTASHDLSHSMVFASEAANRNVGTVLWAFFVGMSGERWFAHHNEHHKHVNHVGFDPDVGIPFVFSEKQFPRRPTPRFPILYRWQHVTFWIALPFVYISYVTHSVIYALVNPSLRNLVEVVLISLHFIVLFSIALYFLPILVATVYLGTIILTGGMYLGLIFAPNHKGMEEIGPDEAEHWTQQITSTRNITPNAIVFFLYGGLNYQIEHHLFTDMSRFRLGKARVLVRDFCRKNNISYHEVPWPRTIVELYAALKREAHKNPVASR